MPADEFMGRHLAEIRERMMNHGLHKSQKAPTIRYGGMILDTIRRVFDHGMFMGWIAPEVCEQLKKVRMIPNDRRASAPREQRDPTNEELNEFCVSLMSWIRCGEVGIHAGLLDAELLTALRDALV